MKGITSYISEVLKINSKSKIAKGVDSYSDDEFIYKVKTSSGKEYQWFTWWKHLMKNGPMSKHDLLTDFNLSPTSYATQFAQLSKKNIIVPSHGKLEAKEPKEWRKI